MLFSRDPDLHAELQGTASRVLRPGLLWNARRVLELLGYAVAYNPALLPLAYGRPLRRGLDRGDEIAAVGDAFTLDDIPLHAWTARPARGGERAGAAPGVPRGRT